MESLSLNLSLNQNRALNQDKTTALRSLPLVQGETYGINLSLFSGSSQVAPALSDFAFILREAGGTNLVSVNSVSPSGSGYFFSLPVVSPAFSPSCKGYFSFAADGQIEIIEPFGVNISKALTSGNTAAYVSTVNGLSSDITFSGSGNISVSTQGQNVIIYGSGSSTATGDYYPNSNPSGYISASTLAPYATSAALTAATGTLQAEISNLNNHTGDYYPKTNPSGYLQFNGNGGSLTNVVHTAGDQTIAGNKNFTNAIIVDGGINTSFLSDTGGGAAISLASKGCVATEPLATQAVLTKISTSSPAVATLDSAWGSATDGNTITITVDSTAVVFEFDTGNPGHPPTFTLDFSSWDGVTSGSFSVTTHVGVQSFGWSTGGAGNIPSDLSLYGTPDTSADGWSYTTSGSQITYTFDTNEVADMSGLESVSGTTVTLVSSDAGQAPGGADVSGSNTPVAIVASDDTSTETNLINAINTAFSGTATAVSVDSNNLTITSVSTGSSASVSFAPSGISVMGSNGTGTDGTGTNSVSIFANQNPRKTYITDIIINVDSTSWATADIEVGYWDGSTFTQIAVIGQSSLTAGIHFLRGDIQLASVDALNAFYFGNNVDIIARTSSAGTPKDESTGGDATIWVRGYYANS
ncbi:MAG: hypothetical protein P4L99_01335 [Chthoniobacter sp.]|nr:hypothetical protein [Chthoniobacter sp.]